jgi:hypothetical protein
MTIKRFAILLGVLAGTSVLIAAAIAATRPFTSTSQGPRAPIRLMGPARTSASPTATFRWSRGDARTSSFRCRLDRGRFTRCKSGVAYRRLGQGPHTFTLIALDAAGHRSAAAKGNAKSPPPSWSWTVGQVLSISGNVDSPLYPGAAPVAIDTSLRNPYSYSLSVSRITLRVRAVRAPQSRQGFTCTTADFTTSNYAGKSFTAPPGVSALSRDHVPRAQWPAISMVDRPVNQDGCKGATLQLAYQGAAIRRAGKR